MSCPICDQGSQGTLLPILGNHHEIPQFQELENQELENRSAMSSMYRSCAQVASSESFNSRPESCAVFLFCTPATPGRHADASDWLQPHQRQPHTARCGQNPQWSVGHPIIIPQNGTIKIYSCVRAWNIPYHPNPLCHPVLKHVRDVVKSWNIHEALLDAVWFVLIWPGFREIHSSCSKPLFVWYLI